jgi:very-short-patch-repair endonuclease
MNVTRASDHNDTIVRARELRRSMSLPERLLWQALRERPGSLKFRRQHPLGRYVLDFYCPAARLVVEVDGQSHGMGRRPEQDAVRDRWLTEQGYEWFGSMQRTCSGTWKRWSRRSWSRLAGRVPLHQLRWSPSPRRWHGEELSYSAEAVWRSWGSLTRARSGASRL